MCGHFQTQISPQPVGHRPRPSGLGEIDGLHGTSTQSCILTYDLCTGEPLRRPKPAQDEWYVIMSGHPFNKALAAYWGGTFVQGLRCHFISMPGKSPMKLEVTSRHDHSCLLGRKASKQTNKTRWPIVTKFYLNHHWGGGKAALGFGPDRIETLVSMATDSSHRVIMGKML